jgi:hypothetical protein
MEGLLLSYGTNGFSPFYDCHGTFTILAFSIKAEFLQLPIVLEVLNFSLVTNVHC